MAEDLELRDARPLPVMDDEEIRRTFRVAKAMAESGTTPDAKDPTKVFAVIMAGRDLGLTPSEAISALRVVHGKIEASGDFHASRVKASAKYDYTIQDITNERCEILFWQDGDELGTSTFTMEDAELAGLAKQDTYKKYPRNMLFNRAMSNGVAWYCPDVMGGRRIYAPGEIDRPQDVTAGEGEYVEPDKPLRDVILDWLSEEGVEDLMPNVEATILHARDLGHAGYSDIGSIGLALSGQNRETVAGWLENARVVLNALEARPDKVEGAEVASDQSALELEQEALRLADEADAAEVNEEPEKAEALRAEAAGLHSRVAEMTDPEQLEID